MFDAIAGCSVSFVAETWLKNGQESCIFLSISIYANAVLNKDSWKYATILFSQP